MALSVVWRPGNERSGAENLRSFFALERGPFARPRARSVVRVATALPDASPASNRAARERIDAVRVD